MNTGGRLNSSFKKILYALTLVLVLIPFSAGAINIHGLYTSSCKRELGIIVNVNDSKVQLLSIKGKIFTIPRHEIIFMTYYAIDSLPTLEIENADEVEMAKIRTLQENKIVDFVSGWPIDYSEDNISFLNLKGHEVIITRESIWEIEFDNAPEQTRFINDKNYWYTFIHPYPFKNCPDEPSIITQKIKLYNVFPQQLLSDPVKIKRELDRLQKGREKVQKYESWQQFYPVPQVYTNDTSLGYWFTYGSRYGASNNRSNNLTPFLQNEYSSGPFGYQHLFLTGSGPMPYSIHEEPQTQIYYRLKADYFHTAIMLDPNLFLMPYDKYSWSKNDLNKYDDRHTQTISYEIGLDYSYFTIQTIIGFIPFGMRMNNLYFLEQTGSFRAGATFQNHLFKIELQYELPVGDEEIIEYYNYEYVFEGEIKRIYRLSVYRLNFETAVFRNISILYSIIYKTLKFQNTGKMAWWNIENYNERQNSLDNLYEELSNETDPEAISNIQWQIEDLEKQQANYEFASDQFENELFKYKSTSLTNAFYLKYAYSYKYNFGCFASLEYHSLKFKNSIESKKKRYFYPKFGVHASLSF